MRYNKKKALADNVNAIETALAVHGQGRQATDSEKKTLALYSGFGGIKEVLNIGTDKPMPDGMAEPMKRLQEILLAFEVLLLILPTAFFYCQETKPTS